jgi:hypothetical protein
VQLNAAGLRKCDGKLFNEGCVRMLMVRQGLESALPKSRPTSGNLHKHEWYIGDLAKKVRLSYGTIHQWIQEGRIESRRLDNGRWVVIADDSKCQELLAFRECHHRRKHHESSSAEAEL